MREVAIPSFARLASTRRQIRLRDEERDDTHLPPTAIDARIEGEEDPVAALNADTNHIFQPPAPDNFLHPGRISIVHDAQTDYQRVFDVPGLSRRTSQIHNYDAAEQYRESECAKVLIEWFGQCIDYPEADNLLPQALHDRRRGFDEMPVCFLPQNLRWSNDFVRRFMLGAILKKLGIRQQRIEHFVENNGEMGDGRRELRQHLLGRVYEVLPFLGIASPGHLIYRPPRGVPVGDSMLILHSEYEEIRKKLYTAEKGMITLAQRVARWVIRKIVYRLGQVDRAAEAVLGSDWFELPYDRSYASRNWSIDDVFPSGTLIEVQEDGQVEIYQQSDEVDARLGQEISPQPSVSEPRPFPSEGRVL